MDLNRINSEISAEILNRKFVVGSLFSSVVWVKAFVWLMDSCLCCHVGEERLYFSSLLPPQDDLILFCFSFKSFSVFIKCFPLLSRFQHGVMSSCNCGLHSFLRSRLYVFTCEQQIIRCGSPPVCVWQEVEWSVLNVTDSLFLDSGDDDDSKDDDGVKLAPTWSNL